MSETQSRKPDYRLGTLISGTEHKGNVGVAWINQELGRISIRLNPFVVLTAADELVLTLFPVSEDDTTPRRWKKQCKLKKEQQP